MVAIIHTGGSLQKILNYNEQKRKQGLATLLLAVNYPKEKEELNFYQKLARLANQAALNPNVKKNSLHISLNFDPSEKLNEKKFMEIIAYYMNKIGFGNQPFLAYEHMDAGHPHIHILTTNIKPDGKRIDLHNIGRNQSEKARQEIELIFNLVKAEGKKQQEILNIKPVNAQKIQYGKSATRRAITNVLCNIIDDYKYTSLAELNAILNLYNLKAERGREDSRLFQKRGLLYQVLDSKGNKTGTPIKASLINGKPTLSLLEKKFVENESLRQPHKNRIKNAVDWNLLKNISGSLPQLITALQKEGIHTVVRKNESGLIYGITYIDHTTKSVFNGSDLGKSYSVKGILERCGVESRPEQTLSGNRHLHHKENYTITPNKDQPREQAAPAFISELITPTDSLNYTPREIRKRKKRNKIKRSES